MCLAAATLSLCACGTQDNTPKQHQPAQQLSINAPIEAFQTAYDSEGLIVYSGGEPTSPGALEHLAALGVKTVISVDATAPEADAIESLLAKNNPALY